MSRHISLIIVVCSLLFLPACSKEKPKEPVKSMAAPVTVAEAVKKAVPVQLRAIGNVEPYSSVGIKSRAGGELIRVNFSEGQDVKKGDLLFVIDQRPYQNALEAAQSNLLRDSTLAKKAEDDAARYSALFNEQLVSRDDYERVLANAEALRATVAADRSAVKNAGLLLDYSSIYSPVSGRTGSLLIDQGNIIKADDSNPLVVINQIQPVYVSFSVPEKDLAEIKKHMASGKLKAGAYLSKDDNSPEEGLLSFIDNSVDTATGTIKLKAAFSNADKRLWPGQFVNVVVTLTTQPEAVVVPAQAVQTGQKGQFVFVVKDGSAEMRPVNAGIAYEDMIVIEKGVEPGEQVVTDGQMRLMPGAKVEIKNK